MKLRIAGSLASRLKGLLVQNEFEGALLLVPCHDIHTLGMKSPIDVAFVSGSGTILASYRNVGPGKRIRCKASAATIERYSEDSPWFKPGDQVGITAAIPSESPEQHQGTRRFSERQNGGNNENLSYMPFDGIR